MRDCDTYSLDQWTSTSEMLRQWGCPLKYCREFTGWGREHFPNRIRWAVEEVARVANWFEEQDSALDAMVVAGDLEALQVWAESDAWWQIGYKTSSGDADERAQGADEYAEAVQAAFGTLIEVLDDMHGAEEETMEHLTWCCS